MKLMLEVCAVVCVLCLPGAAEPRLSVTINNLAGYDRVIVANAEQIATRIFQDAGVRLDWDFEGDLCARRISLVAVRPAVMGAPQ